VDDLGEVLRSYRRSVAWRSPLILGVVLVPAAFVVTGSWIAASLSALGLIGVAALSGRIRLLVCDGGIVVGGFLRTRRFRWSQITAFSPMVLSTGKPGVTGAVVVDGVNHEILAVQEPFLYDKLRDLNELLLAHRSPTGADHVAPTTDHRRSDWTRRRQTLWLGPGAAWWPAHRSDPPDRSDRSG